MGVAPKSSILTGVSIINYKLLNIIHFWVPSFSETSIYHILTRFRPENDGSFYMPWEDFAKIYDNITICPAQWLHGAGGQTQPPKQGI